MGSGASIEADQQQGKRSAPWDAETYEAMRRAYESSKELDDVELFDLLANVYEATRRVAAGQPPEPAGVQISSGDPNPVSDPQLPAVAVETSSVGGGEAESTGRNKTFIAACGAFFKGQAEADIAKAKELFEAGVNVNYVDGDG